MAEIMTTYNGSKSKRDCLYIVGDSFTHYATHKDYDCWWDYLKEDYNEVINEGCSGAGADWVLRKATKFYEDNILDRQKIDCIIVVPNPLRICYDFQQDHPNTHVVNQPFQASSIASTSLANAPDDVRKKYLDMRLHIQDEFKHRLLNEEYQHGEKIRYALQARYLINKFRKGVMLTTYNTYADLMYQNPVVDTLVSLTDLSLYETQGLTGYAMYDRRPGHLGPENHQQLYYHLSKFLFGIIKEPVYQQGSDYEHYKHYIS